MAAAVQSAPGSHIQGWMSEGELRWLCQTAKEMQSVAEVGCWKGRSTFALCASRCPLVYAVDHFKGSDEPEHRAIIQSEGEPLKHFLYNMRQFNNLHVVIADSVQGAEMVSAVDMVFLDASHEYASVVRDIQAWKPNAKKLLCGHDFLSGDVQRAVFEQCKGLIVTYQSIWYFSTEGKN